MVNGRVGINNFTHISHRGKSVVDYVLIPQEKISHIESFKIHLISDLKSSFGLQHIDRVPDHSMIAWTLSTGNME